MRRLAVLLVLVLAAPLAQAAPEHESALLDVRLHASMPLNLADSVLVPLSQLNPAAPGTSGCHDSGDIRRTPDEGWFRFEETKQQSGCAELRIPVVLPSAVPSVTVQFSADRRIDQGTSNDDLQLPINTPQRVLAYGNNGTVMTLDYYALNHPHEPAPRSFSWTLPGDALGNQFTLGWYFEDAGLGSSPLTGTATGRSFISHVREPTLTFQGLETVPVQVTTTSQRNASAETRIDTIEATINVSTAWLGLTRPILEIELLDSVNVVRIVRPDGATLTSANWGHVEANGRQTVQILAEHLGTTGGEFLIIYEGAVIVPPPPAPAGPTRLPLLVYAALALTGGMYVAATAHQFALSRALHGQQPFTVRRKNVELVLLGAATLGLGLHILLRAFDSLAVVPPNRAGTLLYLLLALLFVGALAHLGIGVIRRRHALEVVQAQALKAANDDLARSNRDLEQFAYVASHDLQEPLRKVMSFTGLLEKRYGDKLDERAAAYIHNANDAAERARELIRDVLAFSRIGSGDEPLVSVDLNELMADVVGDLAEPIKITGGHVTWTNLPSIRGSPSLLRQLLTNLVGNGIKYRDPTRAPQVTVSASRRLARWRIEVTDNGIGIAPEHHEQVFQLFQRLHSRGSAYDGSGIGLAICKRIVEFHGGTIDLDSTPGAGTTFSVEVPIG